MESSNIIKLPFKVKEFKEIEISDNVEENSININNSDYFLGLLNPNFKRNKGAHSFVYALYDAQSFSEDSVPVNAIKISKIFDKKTKKGFKRNRMNDSFLSEIEALKHCSEKQVSHVVDINYSGYLTFSQGDNKEYAFPFYIMEYAETDLKEYMDDNRNEMTYESKVNLCSQLAQGLCELNSLGYYHRDLKPDNIFVFDDDWKIGDLGMVATRDRDNFDGNNTIIGPKGWLSPEAMNKYLTHDSNSKIDCNIDHQSDIFQLGKIFWYIMQGNVPIGVIHNADYINIKGQRAMYVIIMNMLAYNKVKRVKNLQKEVVDKLENILKRI